jgi:Tol biopolymer transport system component
LSLTSGTRLGIYEILAPLGAGGMGEVYRARDTRLGREVAIKVLRDAFALDAEQRARFEREARLLASLNHPNIAAIYGLDAEGESRFLVLELVPGETLAERLARGPLPLADALGFASQIAEALEAAHEAGIIHRDLKPANVKATPDGRAKLLDFGLGKVLSSALAGSTGDSVTLARDETGHGVILGTAAYMSPEQARGQPVDRRTDIWSFGCVLYEMLCGRKAFAGATVSDVIAAILDREPDWRALPPGTPERIKDLLHRCLRKEAPRRLRDVGDARIEIDEARALLRTGRAGGGAASRRRALIALAVAVLGAAAFVFLRGKDAARPSPSREAAISVPVPTRLDQVTSAAGLDEYPAWSPDGKRLAYSAEVRGVRKIFLKQLDTGEESQLTRGTADDIQAAFAPDGAAVLFVRARDPAARLEPGDVFGDYSGGDVWSVDLASGRESLVVQNAFNPAFSPDGTRIAVDAAWVGPHRIWTVDSRGRNPQQVTTEDSEAVSHVWPRFSPDGARIVFQSFDRTKFDVKIVDVASRAMTWVTNDLAQDVQPSWAPSGKEVFFSSFRSGGLNLWRVPVDAQGRPSGPPRQLTTGAGQDAELAIAPDGTRIAFATLRQNADIWRLPVDPATGKAAGAPEKVVATTREDSRADWSPDGRTIAFNSDRTGEMNLWLYSPVDRVLKQLTRGPGGDFQPTWSPDGKTIAFFSSRSGNADVWTVTVATGDLRQVTHEPSLDINPFFSPDGSRIAFQSDQGGHLELWVMAADGSGRRPLTSIGVGGHFMRWSRDGSRVVFRCPCGGKSRAMEVTVAGGEPTPLPEVAGGSHLSFSPNGELIMDVVGHRALWVSPLAGGRPARVFEFPDPEVRVDYPVWSPDGRSVLFDRYQPQGGDIWILGGVEPAP